MPPIWVLPTGPKLSLLKWCSGLESFMYPLFFPQFVPASGTAPVGTPVALLAESEEEVAVAQARAQAISQGPGQGPPTPHAVAVAAAASPEPPPPAPVAAPATKGVATPYANKLAKQHIVDIAGVVGTGPHGRVTPADIQAAAGINPKPKLDIYPLAQKWRVLLKKARTRQLQPNEYSSGTFILSNLGMFGVDRFDAIPSSCSGSYHGCWSIKTYCGG